LTSEQDSSQVYVADADGAHARRLPPCRTPKCAGHWEPAWSPDGTRLAVPTDIGAPPGQSELYTVRPDGTGLRRLTAFGSNGPRATQPRWTPDGTAILYTRTTQSGLPRQIYAITRDGRTDAPVATARASTRTRPCSRRREPDRVSRSGRVRC
jgi:Tol biopolymer transport system component